MKHVSIRLILIAAGCLVLAGCKNPIDGQPITLEKGTYPGQPEAELTDEQRDALRSRMSIQSSNSL